MALAVGRDHVPGGMAAGGAAQRLLVGGLVGGPLLAHLQVVEAEFPALAGIVDARLQARVDDPGKRWKFRLDDLEVRKKWDAYQSAYERALRATSSSHAPWHVIPADSKRHRNLMVAELLVKRMRDMKLAVPPADQSLDGLQVK